MRVLALRLWPQPVRTDRCIGSSLIHLLIRQHDIFRELLIHDLSIHRHHLASMAPLNHAVPQKRLKYPTRIARPFFAWAPFLGPLLPTRPKRVAKTVHGLSRPPGELGDLFHRALLASAEKYLTTYALLASFSDKDEPVKVEKTTKLNQTIHLLFFLLGPLLFAM